MIFLPYFWGGPSSGLARTGGSKTLSEFGSPQTGPKRGTKAGPPWLLRLRSGSAQTRSGSAQTRSGSAQGPLRLCSGAAQALLRRCTASAQGKAATGQGGGPQLELGGKKILCPTIGVGLLKWRLDQNGRSIADFLSMRISCATLGIWQILGVDTGILATRVLRARKTRK